MERISKILRLLQNIKKRINQVPSSTTKNKNMTNNQLTSHFFDILCGMAIPKKQNDEFAKMKREWKKESTQLIKKYISKKYIKTCKNKITIGERNPITITITYGDYDKK